MDSSKLSVPVVILFLASVVPLISCDTVAPLCCFSRIFSFGDSNTDSGNNCLVNSACGANRLPYGETYFHKPSGRNSDGRIIVDFIAQAYGIPFQPPSKGGSTAEYFKDGANFAVAASQALNNSAFKKLTNMNPWNTDSLSTQLQSLKNLLPTISQGSSVSAVMASSLFVVGEIGGVDYIIGLANKKPMDEIRSWVPSVVDAIISALNDLISLGATTLIVPGNYMFGCSPWFLLIYQSNNTADYDNFGCIKSVNELSAYHNTMLMEELAKLRLLHPLINIVYADYYGAQSQLYLNAQTLGFAAPLYACCGVAGQPYNMSLRIGCGSSGSQVCPDPSKYVSWDGDHLTEAASHQIANGILYGPYSFPPFLQTAQTAKQELGSGVRQYLK
uniref:Esterase n=1 Tax=Leersia perrieri TaxID=77586 RepID=A0A0D9XPW8_9ORYZ